MRGPGRIATDVSVRDRVRRLPRDTAWRREAKRILREDPSATLAALQALLQGGDVTQGHIDAHIRWMNENDQ